MEESGPCCKSNCKQNKFAIVENDVLRCCQGTSRNNTSKGRTRKRYCTSSKRDPAEEPSKSFKLGELNSLPNNKTEESTSDQENCASSMCIEYILPENGLNNNNGIQQGCCDEPSGENNVSEESISAKETVIATYEQDNVDTSKNNTKIIEDPSRDTMKSVQEKDIDQFKSPLNNNPVQTNDESLAQLPSRSLTEPTENVDPTASDQPSCKSITSTSSGSNKNVSLSKPESKRSYCDPTNCDKLNSNKKWKTCCEKAKCPLNDPTTSTYKFLLKAKMCCNRRGCQLAAKICDIYEPLVKCNLDTRDMGESMYHYLGKDAGTAGVPLDEEKKEYDIETDEENEFDENPVEISHKVLEPAEAPMFIPNHIADERESIFIDPIPAPSRERRVSSVSWKISDDEVKDDNLFTATSIEDVVNAATAQANEFRNIPKLTGIGDTSNETYDRTEPVELSRNYISTDVLFKSTLDTVNLSESTTKTKCCGSLRNKFKRKRKKKDEEEDEGNQWRKSSDGSTKANRINNFVDPAEERQDQINKMLNNM